MSDQYDAYHTLIDELTHHNKVLELLILVVIGAGLVPLHHRLEHLLIDRLTKPRPVKQADFRDRQSPDLEDISATPSTGDGGIALTDDGAEADD